MTAPPPPDAPTLLPAPSPAPSLPPALAALVDAIVAQNPMHRGFLLRALAHTRADDRDRLERYLRFCQARGLATDELAECYLTIVIDTLREQIHFQRNGRYRHSTFAEVAADVYFNDAYMSRYMIGLALTAFLWPNHLAMFRYFAEQLPTDQTGSYLEIGPGHGYYLMTAMERSAYHAYTAIDISTTSLELARALVTHSGLPGRKDLTLRCEDFLASDLDEESFDAVVMGEVLEHVEDPDAFLARIVTVTRPGAFLFVTTCINAPAVDHITLFPDTATIEALFRRHTLRVRSSLICPYEGRTLEECETKRLAVNVAYVLERA